MYDKLSSLRGGVRSLLASAFTLAASFSFADDIDLTAQIRAAYEADPTSVKYTDGGHYSSSGEPITAYTAFDGITSQRWLSPTPASANYLQIELPADFNGGALPCVKSIRLQGFNMANRAPKSVKFSVSNDGMVWTECGAADSLSSIKTSFDIATPHYGRFLRFDILSNNGGDRHNVCEIYYTGIFMKPVVAICPGRDESGNVTTNWEYPMADANGSYTASQDDMTFGASKFSCIGYTLATSTDGGATWVSTQHAEKSVTITPAADTSYRVTWRWRESPTEGATTVYVSPDGDGSDGTSWAKAYKSLDGLSLTANTFVKIAGGTYTMDTGVAMSSVDGITVSGGWDASSDTCDPAANPTRFTTSAGHAGVVLSFDIVTNARVSVIRFADCVNSSSTAAADGVAANIKSSSGITFENCLFRNGIAHSTAASGTARARGGAVFVTDSTGIVFDACDFDGNRAQTFPSNGSDASSNTYVTQGGAVCQVDTVANYRACRFVGNQCTSMAVGAVGGGVFAYVASAQSNRHKKATFKNCVFLANQVNNRGASSVVSRSGVALYNSSGYISNSYGSGGSAIAGFCMHIFDSTFAMNRWAAIAYTSTSSSTIGLGTIMNCKFCDQPTRLSYNPSFDTVTVSGDSECSRDEVAAMFDTSDLYVSTTGSDDAAGTASAPLKTITAALAKAEDGTMIHVASGTYGAGETFPLDLRGHVFLKLAGESDVTIDASASGNMRVLEIVDSGYCTVSNVTLTGGNILVSGEAIGGGVVSVASAGTRFEGVTVTGNSAKTTTSSGVASYGGGIYTVASEMSLDDTTVSNNCIGTDGYRANTYGAGICALTSDLTLERCRLSGNIADGSLSGSHHSYGGGIYFGHFGKNSGDIDQLKVVNSVFDGNGMGKGYYDGSNWDRVHGFAAYMDGYSAFVNCTLVSNRITSVERLTNTCPLGGYAQAVTNCVSFGHYYDFQSTSVGEGNAYASMESTPEGFGTQITDPMFKAGTFVPVKTSPLVDTGVDIGWTKSDRDVYGKCRLKGAAVDIGAAEFHLEPGILILFR